MSAGAESERSFRARLCVAFFLVWLCHVGRSQLDQWNSRTPTCGKVVNSSVEDDPDCDWVARFWYRFCDGDNVTLKTDPVSFVNSTSSVLTQTNFTELNDTMFYYKLCLFYPSWNFFNGRNVLINCSQNETELDLEVEWDTPGWLNLSVTVYREEDMKVLGCAKTSITIAENSGLDLNVSLKNNPSTPSVNPVPFPPDPSIDVDFLSDGFVRDGKIYPIGNITFTCLTNRPSATTYYKYSFGDEESEPYTQDGNLTHEYSKVGVYEYVVDAVALTGRGNRGFHAAHTGHIYIMEPVSNISMVANEHNTFQQNVESQVNISAHGTRPILACWLVSSAKDVVISSPSKDNSSVNPSPLPNYTCKDIINQSIFEPMLFTELGEFVFITVFGNNVSKANSTITFTVIKNPSKVVVASTSTLVAILAVLIAIVCVLMIVMSLYIPYRKYKTKYTETANFKFVDLSESTNWDRARMKVKEFADKFSRTKKPSKVGLVNEKNESTRLTNFPYESVS